MGSQCNELDNQNMTIQYKLHGNIFAVLVVSYTILQILSFSHVNANVDETESLLRHKRIVNGTPVEKGAGLPKSVVLLLIKRRVSGGDGKTKTSRCTGNILDSSTIIT